ncbi:hypothetical protein BS78_K288500 [Paspalum vaginatum]|uniref:BTB domain-containing protein n=1 Tax=Paspalum vaginatum TaxID=158149 RepID=A0A9W7XDX9_9POAL|nr:hypothetical protein BS78_K288500 [Paspalum vaginatum]
MATSPPVASATAASAAIGGTANTPIPQTIFVSHVLRIDGFSGTKDLGVGESIKSSTFLVGGHAWYVRCYPCGEDEDSTGCVSLYLCLLDHPAVIVRFEMALLNLAGETISSTQSFCAFSAANESCGLSFLRGMQPRSSPLLADGFHVRCDIAVVDGITTMTRPSDLHRHQHRHLGADLISTLVGVDVAFEVGREVSAAHKCVLAARSTGFMAELLGPAGAGKKENTVTRVRVDDMEPGVFKALLHFIYIDTLPEADVGGGDKVAMAQSLLRLKLICADMLCGYVDASTAVATLQLADKHGCPRLKEACIKFLNEVLAKVVAS